MSDSRLDISLRYEKASLRLDIDAHLPLDGITALFGPSGAGKTTLLRLISGFETPDSGIVRLGSTELFNSAQRVDRPAHARPIGFLFQDKRLFPHLSVRRNLEYALHRARRSDGARFDDVIDALDLAPLLERDPISLSGGETQRAALGRAILNRPELLLLDEPVSALDWARKAEILPFLETTVRQFSIPALYVTHSPEEVALIADRVLLLDQGKTTLFSDPRAIFNSGSGVQPWYQPANILTGNVLNHARHERLTEIGIGTHRLTLPLAPNLQTGDRVRLRIDASDIALAVNPPGALSIRNILEGQIQSVTEHADSAHVDIRIDLDGIELISRITWAAMQSLRLGPGQRVHVLIKSASIDGPAG